MPEDDRDVAGTDDGEELELPGGEPERAREGGRKPVVIPEKAKTSGMIQRRVMVRDEALRRREEGSKQPEEPLAKGPERPQRWEGQDEGGARVEPPVPEESAPPPARPLDPEVDLKRPASGPGVTDGLEEAPRRRLSRGREPEGEEAWTGGQRSSLWWVLVGIVCIGVVAFLTKKALEQTKAPVAKTPPMRVEDALTLEGTPVEEFVNRSVELLPLVADLLAQVETAEGEEFVPLVRGGAETVSLMEAWRKRSPALPRHNRKARRDLHAAATGSTGYLMLTGQGEDYLPAVAYFLKEDGRMVYDWQASEGYSEVLPHEVAQLSDREPKLVRGVVSVSGLYTPQFPEEDYRCYTLHHRDHARFVWVFAERDSVADLSMGTSFVAPDLMGTEGRVTVKIRKGPPGSRPNELELVEFLHNDWLAPDE